jgi:hypothetical protein
MVVAAMAVAVTDSSEEATTLNLLSAICYLLFRVSELRPVLACSMEAAP